MASVGRARVLAGAYAFKAEGLKNVTDTYRGQLLTSDRETVSAIIKDLPDRELANEVLAAALGAHLGLPIPRAFVAIADDSSLTTHHAPKIGGSSFLFASADVCVPSVAQLVLPEPGVADKLRLLVQELQGVPRLGDFYGFDSWLANVDRNIGNLLFGGTGQAWLIDHGRCFTGPTWQSDHLKCDAPYQNRLSEWLTPNLSRADKDRRVGEAESFAGQLSSVDVRAIGEDNEVSKMLPQGDFDALVTFLTDRVPHVRGLAARALGMVI